MRYYPQSFKGHKFSNSKYPPQGLKPISQGFLLDLFSGAQVAYSLRRLSSTYTGDSFRVNRLSDSAEMDIGFLSNGDLDIDTLTAFIGGSDGEVIVMYDQSGNSLDLDMLFVPLPFPPRIIISGILQIVNDLPAINFSGLDLLQTISSLPSPASNLFTFTLMKILNLTNNPINWNLNAPNEGPGEVSTRMYSNSGQILWNAGNDTTEQLDTIPGFADMLQHLLVNIKTAGVDNQKIILDEEELAQQTQVTSSTTLGTITLGNSRVGGTNFAIMNFQEFVFYTDNQLANVSPISKNILNYWKHKSIVTESGIPIATEAGQVILAV